MPNGLLSRVRAAALEWARRVRARLGKKADEGAADRFATFRKAWEPVRKALGPALQRTRAKVGPWLQASARRMGPVVAKGWSATSRGLGRVLGPAARRLRLQERGARLVPESLRAHWPDGATPWEYALGTLKWGWEALKKQDRNFQVALVSIVLATFFLADVTSLMLERAIPEPPPLRQVKGSGKTRPAALDDYSGVFSRNLFNSRGIIPGEGAPGVPSMPASDQPAQPTTLPFHLVGTLILRDELRSLATIEDKSASLVYPVRVTDEIPNKAKILLVESRRVTFLNLQSNRKEFVEFPKEALGAGARFSVGASSAPKDAGAKTEGVEQKSPNTFAIARDEVNKTLADLNNVLTQARCVPNFSNGQPDGFKCFQIVPGSIYDKLGLKNNDVLCGLNGQPINDPAKAFELLTELKTSNHLELCIKREGKQNVYAYDIN